MYSTETAYIEDDFLPSSTIKKGSKKKKKSKKRKSDKAKDQGELCLSYSPGSQSDYNPSQINDARKKKRKHKNKGKTKDKSAQQPSKVARPSKMCKLCPEVTVKSQTDTPIKPQRRVPKTAKCVSQGLGKARPKKRVLFDLSPKGSVVKTYSDVPKFCSKTPFVDTDDEEDETYASTLQAVLHDEESPRGAEGLHSQDLFITQNTFLSPSLLPSEVEFTSTPELKQSKWLEPPSKSTAETATQTENFFTFKHSNFLSFQLSKLTQCSEQPVDLSLPHRKPGQRSTAIMKEDSDLHHRGKEGLTQINFVQMRLNESFFFKMKGEKDSPKSQCPLKKLEEDCGKKQKK